MARDRAAGLALESLHDHPCPDATGPGAAPPLPCGSRLMWIGKIAGVGLGLLTRRWQLVLLGLFLGHLFDIGWFSRKAAAEAPPSPASDDPYRILEVDPAASDSAIESAYRRLIAQYHPDRVAGAAPEIVALAETRARAINQAYERIQKVRRG
jgi:hypothetical protein